MKSVNFQKKFEADLRKKYLPDLETEAGLVGLVGVQYDRVIVKVDSTKEDKKTVYEHDGVSWVYVNKVENIEHEISFTDDHNIYITDKDRKPKLMGDVLPFEDIDDLLDKDPAIYNKLYITKKGKLYYYNRDGAYKLVSGGGGAGGTNRLPDVATYAEIITTYPKPDDWDCVVVLNDEGHDGQKTWYVFDGAVWAYQGIYFNETLVQEISDRGVRTSVINADTDYELPFEYIIGRKHLEIHVEDELLIQDIDYVEDTLTAGYVSNKIQFKYAIPKEARLIFKRKVSTSEGDSRITRITKDLWLSYANLGWTGLNNLVSDLGFDTLTKSINVDATAGTVVKTIPSNCRIGTRLLYRKIDSSTNVVTINTPNGETVTKSNLTNTTLTSEGDFWEYEKISSTKWVLRDGFESGRVSVGIGFRRFERYHTGVQICLGRVSDDSAPSVVNMALGSYSWSFVAQTLVETYMKPFVGDLPVVTGGAGTKATDDVTIGGLASIEGTSLISVQITSWAHEMTKRLKSYEAKGRWY